MALVLIKVLDYYTTRLKSIPTLEARVLILLLRIDPLIEPFSWDHCVEKFL